MLYDEDIKAKLLILFILEKYETAVPEDMLVQICSFDNNWIPYFIFQQLLGELVEAGFVVKGPDEVNKTGSVLTLSPDGRVCLSHFYKDIYRSVRDEVTEYIRANKLRYKKKQEFLCRHTQNEDGTTRVNCSVLNGTKTLFDFTFNVPTVKKAEEIVLAWQTKATDVYRCYLDLLIE